MRLLAALVALTLTACGPLQQLTALGEQIESVTEPTDIYVLTPKSTFADDLPQVRRQLVVEEPSAASHINTDRVAVKPGPYQVEYYPAARWPDRAPLLVQRLLVESFENTGKVGSVDALRIGLASDFILLTDLREFQAEATENPGEPVTVNVQLNLKIVEERAGLIIASESFNHRTQATSQETIDVITAFDDALNRAMRDSVEWAVRQIARYEPDETAAGF